MTAKANKWYTSAMTKTARGKLDKPVPIKLNAEQKAAFEDVGSKDKEDRPLGYVIRELAIRGLVEYRKDGRLRASDEEASAAMKLSSVAKVKDSRKAS